jgi:hypothetical protein
VLPRRSPTTKLAVVVMHRCGANRMALGASVVITDVAMGVYRGATRAPTACSTVAAESEVEARCDLLWQGRQHVAGDQIGREVRCTSQKKEKARAR